MANATEIINYVEGQLETIKCISEKLQDEDLADLEKVKSTLGMISTRHAILDHEMKINKPFEVGARKRKP